MSQNEDKTAEGAGTLASESPGTNPVESNAAGSEPIAATAEPTLSAPEPSPASTAALEPPQPDAEVTSAIQPAPAASQPGSPQPSPSSDLETSFGGRSQAVGDIVSGAIVKIAGEIAFVDYGAKSEGYIELAELRDADGSLKFNEGDRIDAMIASTKGAVRLSRRKIEADQTLETLRAAYKEQRAVDGQVVGVNRGGYEVRVEGVRAFCPASQLSDRYVREPTSMVGKTFSFRITEHDDAKGLVVSRRVLLEEDAKKRREDAASRLEIGAVLQGTVTQIKDYGAFIDLGGGLDGLVHVSELSHKHVKHPSELMRVGDAVEVVVLRIDAEKNRVGLSMKQLEADPWTDFARSLERGQKLTGKVARMQAFGAFINLAPGVDGLLHVSAISADERIEHPRSVFQDDQEVEVIVDKISLQDRRIGLITPAVAEKRQTPQAEVKVGGICKGKVTRVERYGVFVEIEPRVVGLVPNIEMGTERGTDHARMFPIGTELEVKIIEVEKARNRIRLSRKALKSDAADAEYNEFKQRQREQVPQSLGTFGDLLRAHLDKK